MDGEKEHQHSENSSNQLRKSILSHKSKNVRTMSEITEGNYNPKKTFVDVLPSEVEVLLVEQPKIRWITLIGSAIIISIACIDPGNLQGDIQVAQDMHYKSIWVLFFSHILLYFFQEMSIKVGVFAGKDLGQLIRINYSVKIKYFLWICSELAIIAADIQEMIGAAIALKLLFGIPLVPSALIVVVIVL